MRIIEMRKFAVLAILNLALAFVGFSQVRYVDGRTTNFTDSKGNIWLPDTNLSKGEIANCNSVAPAITNTTEPGLYKSARKGVIAPGPELTYVIPNLKNGSYTVNLYFAEACSGWTVGKRITAISAQGQVIFPTFDISGEAGGLYKSIVKSFKTQVTAGTLTLVLARVVSIPVISGIEIIPIDTTPPVLRIVSPLAGTHLTAPTSVEINAVDEIALASVTAQLDSAALVQSAVVGSLYSFTSDLTTLPLGNHTLTAVATDTSGNQTTVSLTFVTSISITLYIPNNVFLTWTAPDPAFLGQYYIYRKSPGEVYATTPLSSALTAEYTDPNLIPGQQYSYVVTAVDASLESPVSNEVSVTIPTQ